MFIRAYRWRREEQQRETLWGAWHIAALAGSTFSQSGLPPLGKILPQQQAAPKKLTPEQEATVWKAWAQDHNRRLKQAS